MATSLPNILNFDEINKKLPPIYSGKHFTLLDSRQSSLDIYAFINIYRKDLIGAFIKKVYDLKSGVFVFQISSENKEHRFLQVDLKRGLFFMDSERPQEASSLAMMLRKQVSERKIIDVSQPNFDRIVVMKLSTGQEIIFEMFRDGNLILTESGIIEFALYPREWKSRKVKKGEKYVTPSNIDPLSIDEDNLLQIISKSKGGIIQTLATRLNLGGDLAEEVCFRAGVTREESKFDRNTMSSIKAKLQVCLEEAMANRSYLYPDIPMLSPIYMTHLDIQPEINGDFNDSMVEFLKNNATLESKEETPVSRRIKSMNKSIEEFQKRSEHSRELGSILASNLQGFDKVIRFARKLESSPQELPREIDGIMITGVDPAKKTLTATYSEYILVLDYRKTAGQNMDILFQDSKTYLEKIGGALRAIESSKKEEQKPAAIKKKNRPKEWYEVYHWFRSSEGFLVLAGRDAKSNEKIVKKHLKDNDLYVHADVYGAPSTIIKVEGGEVPTEATIKEACTFAVSLSRAWSAGIRSGSAFWVLPSQVSKTPESGEYVSTGSWIVRGKRNYIFNLNLELEIGKESFKDTERPVVRPADGNWTSHEGFFRIAPGKTKRMEVVMELSKLLSLPRDEIDSVLPPGGSTIVELRKVSS